MPPDTVELDMDRGCPYPVNPERDTVILTPHHIRGRGKFWGKLDPYSGTLRIDSPDDLAFWLEIDLSDVLEDYHALKYHPENPVAGQAIERMKRGAEAIDSAVEGDSRKMSKTDAKSDND